jgi:GcrA cell cycle regulator
MSTNAEWSVQRTEQLKALHVRGLSSSQIASELGISRNAVIGKVTRLKLPARVVAVPAHRPKPVGMAAERITGKGRQAGIARPKPGGRSGEIAKARAEAMSPVQPEPVQTIVDDGPVISLLDLTDQTCRWPIGDPLLPGFGFCGAPPMDGKTYCPIHQQRSKGPPWR